MSEQELKAGDEHISLTWLFQLLQDIGKHTENHRVSWGGGLVCSPKEARYAYDVLAKATRPSVAAGQDVGVEVVRLAEAWAIAVNTVNVMSQTSIHGEDHVRAVENRDAAMKALQDYAATLSGRASGGEK